MDETSVREIFRRVKNASDELASDPKSPQPAPSDSGESSENVGAQNDVAPTANSRSHDVPRSSDSRITALISWAHRDPSWDDKTADEWRDSVLELTAVLRSRGGIDADIDLYHSDDLVVDWTRFGPKRIDETDFTLVVISKAWSDRWSGKNEPTAGAGAVGEADELKGLFQENQEEFQRRVKLILLPGVNDANLPRDLSRLSRYRIDPADFSTFEGLLRAITGQPSVLIPQLSDVPTLPPSISAKASVTSKNKPRRNSDTENMFTELRVLRRRRNQLMHASPNSHAADISRLDDEIAVLESLADSLYSADEP